MSDQNTKKETQYTVRVTRISLTYKKELHFQYIKGLTLKGICKPPSGPSPHLPKTAFSTVPMTIYGVDGGVVTSILNSASSISRQNENFRRSTKNNSIQELNFFLLEPTFF
jgi:hypothetical protein